MAYTLRDLFDDDPEKIDLTNTSLQAFVEAYRLDRPLSDAELSHLPLFLRLHNLRLFTQALYSLGTGARPDDPDWMHDLRAKVVRRIERYRAGFEGMAKQD